MPHVERYVKDTADAIEKAHVVSVPTLPLLLAV